MENKNNFEEKDFKLNNEPFFLENIKEDDSMALDLSEEEINKNASEKMRLHLEEKTLAQYKVPELVVVETGDIVEQQSRDIAEKNLDKDQENLKKSGLKGFIKNIWKHNITKEYTRQLEITKVRENLLATGNIYAGEDNAENKDLEKSHKEAMNALIERFAYQDEMGNTLEHKEAGEKREEISLENDFKSIMYSYILGEISQDEFVTQKADYLKNIVGENYTDEKLKFVDNILEIADNLKAKFDYEKTLGILNTDMADLQVQLSSKLSELNKVVVAREAKLGVRTEAQYTKVDKVVEWIKRTPVGGLVNSGTLSLAVGMASSAIGSVAQGITKSVALGTGIVGAGAGVAGGIAAMRESNKLANERRQHSREMAKGGEIQDNSKRREELEKYRYETKSANELVGSIEKILSLELNIENRDNAERLLADIESRILISDSKKIDLISYSNFDQVEQERTSLDINIAKLKLKIKKFNQNLVDTGSKEVVDESNSTILANENIYQRKLDNKKLELLFGKGGEESGIEAKNRLFQKMKNKKMAGAFVKGALSSLVAGAILQEGTALLDNKRDGVIEGLMSKSQESDYSVTPLEKLREYITNKLEEGKEVLEKIIPKQISLENTEINISSDKYDLVDLDQDGIYHLIDANENVVHPDIDINFLEDGSIAEDTITELQAKGIQVSQETFGIPTGENIEKTLTIDDYMDYQEGLKVEYIDYATNNTDFADGNELGLDYGVNDQGEVVLKLNMTEGGSVTTAGEQINVIDEMSKGKVKVAFYADSDLDKKALVLMEVDTNGDLVVPEHLRNNFFNEEGEFIGGRMQIIVERNNPDTDILESIAIAGLEGKGITEAVIEEPDIRYHTKMSFSLPVEQNIIEEVDFSDNKILEAPLNLPVYDMLNNNERLETLKVEEDSEKENLELSKEEEILEEKDEEELQVEETLEQDNNIYNQDIESESYDNDEYSELIAETIDIIESEQESNESGQDKSEQEKFNDLLGKFESKSDEPQSIEDFYINNASEEFKKESNLNKLKDKGYDYLETKKLDINTLELILNFERLLDKNNTNESELKTASEAIVKSVNNQINILKEHFKQIESQKNIDNQYFPLNYVRSLESILQDKINKKWEQIKLSRLNRLESKGYNRDFISNYPDLDSKIEEYESIFSQISQENLDLESKEELFYSLESIWRDIIVIFATDFNTRIPVEIRNSNQTKDIAIKQKIFDEMFETESGKTELNNFLKSFFERIRPISNDIIESLSKELEITDSEDAKEKIEDRIIPYTNYDEDINIVFLDPIMNNFKKNLSN